MQNTKHIQEIKISATIPNVSIEQAIIDSGVTNKDYLFTCLYYPENDLVLEEFPTHALTYEDRCAIAKRNELRSFATFIKEQAKINGGYKSDMVIFSLYSRKDYKLKTPTLREMLTLAKLLPSLPLCLQHSVAGTMQEDPKSLYLRIVKDERDQTQSEIKVEHPEWDTDSECDFIVSPDEWYYIVGTVANA
jgi:hypothetical protein